MTADVDRPAAPPGPPDNFTPLPDEGPAFLKASALTVMTNLDHSIKPGAEDMLRDQPMYGLHAGWEFNGKVWYQNGLFHEQVWRYGQPVGYRSAATLEELATLVNDEWGWE